MYLPICEKKTTYTYLRPKQKNSMFRKHKSNLVDITTETCRYCVDFLDTNRIYSHVFVTKMNCSLSDVH